MVTIAENGKRVVELAQAEHFDLILMDCDMPELDGLDATRLIRQIQAPNARTPVIALTASIAPEDRDRCLVSGMNDYLRKPVRIDVLAVALEKWLPKAGLHSPEETELADIWPSA